MPFLWGPAECKPKAVASHYLYNPSSWPCSEMWLLQFAANASPCSYDLIPDKGGGGRERQGLLTFASGQHSSISQTLMIFLLLFNYLPQLMKFMSSSSKAVAEGVWGVGWLGASPPTSSKHMGEYHLLPLSHLRCVRSILHCEGKKTIFFPLSVSLLSKLQTPLKEQVCQIEEKRNCSNMHQSASWVSETNLETKGSVWTQYIRI